jgi:hypothetical protein
MLHAECMQADVLNTSYVLTHHHHFATVAWMDTKIHGYCTWIHGYMDTWIQACRIRVRCRLQDGREVRSTSRLHFYRVPTLPVHTLPYVGMGWGTGYSTHDILGLILRHSTAQKQHSTALHCTALHSRQPLQSHIIVSFFGRVSHTGSQKTETCGDTSGQLAAEKQLRILRST